MTPRIPTATYRLQFREGMDFARAATLAPYFARIGVSHLYASPLFQATEGSTHGYDVTDHAVLDEALGGRTNFERMARALDGVGLGLVLDIVPNHMAATPANPWWRDVLRHGRESRFARHFDIDWDAPKLLLTQLGRPYGEVLEAGELSLGREADGPVLRCYDNAFPLAPGTWALAAPGIDVPARERWPDWIASAANAAALDAALASADHERIHAVHEAQPWRLAWWRAARDMLTHRRFFEITELVGVRVEDEAVFDDVHATLFELMRGGSVHGLRIDHVDGLADPARYLAMLRDKAPKLADGSDAPIWVEKILGPGERLPPSWPVEGTTGYVAGRAIAGVLTDRAAEGALTGAYAAFTGVREDYATMLRAAKHEIITVNLASELGLLTRLAEAVAADDAVARDFGPDTMRTALVALMTAMPVYRTYLTDGPPSATDEDVLAGAEADAAKDRAVDDPTVVHWLVRALREARGPAADTLRRRLQQTTGAVMAKSLEDTLFYRTHRLISLNEVGAEPDHFGLADEDWHAEMEARASHMPHGLTATATHDTKRGEDARMRITAVASAPEAWAALVGSLDRQLVAELPNAPNANTRWLFYQALLGAYEEGQPREALRERMEDYMIKAAREAKLRTSWVAPDEGHEERVRGFVAHALGDGQGFLDAFLAEAAPFLEKGRTLSLQQVALKCTMPGVPDFYQGTGLGDFSLVDPDNRRPIDFDTRTEVLDALERGEVTREGMAPKAALTLSLLALRRARADLFENGAYRALETRYGPRDAEAGGTENSATQPLPPLAFARGGADAVVVVIDRHAEDGRAVSIEWPFADAPACVVGEGGTVAEGWLTLATPSPVHVLTVTRS